MTMQVNQLGEEIEETALFEIWSDPATDAERDKAISLILCHLNCAIVRTNATKHGTTEIELRQPRYPTD